MQLDLNSVETIQVALFEVPSLVDTMENTGVEPTQILAWLCKVETLLAAKRLTVSAVVATNRATLISATKGRIVSGLMFNGRVSRSKLVSATAAHVLDQSVQQIREALAPTEAKLYEADQLAMQLVAIAKAKGINAFGSAPLQVSDVTAWLESASVDADLVGGFTNLESLVGRSDSLLILARCIERVNGD